MRCVFSCGFFTVHYSSFIIEWQGSQKLIGGKVGNYLTGLKQSGQLALLQHGAMPIMQVYQLILGRRSGVIGCVIWLSGPSWTEEGVKDFLNGWNNKNQNNSK